MSTAACRIPANADVVGLGIRLAIYAQNLLCFFTPFGALLDGKVTMSELDLAETQTTTNLVLAFAILISAIVQATTLGLTNYHASIILDMSWMNNTNASIYFLLYVQHKSQPTPGSGHTVEPTFSAWARHIRCSFLAAYGQGGDPSLQARDSVRDDIWIHDIANDGVTPAAALRNLVKHSVLLLGSLHLSLMAGLGVWLWSDIRGFGNMRDRAANDCAAEHAHISILGRPIPFSSGPLRIAFLTAYGLFLVPGINLLLPMVVFLGFYYCARGLAPPMIIQPGPRRMPWDMNAWERLRDSTLRSVQNSIARRWSIFPPVLGLVFLLAINLIFIIDIELTLRQNANLRGQDEFLWGFGQTLAIIPLLMPLRDISQALIVSRMRQRDLGKALGYTVMLKDWDTVHAFIARGADPNIEMRGVSPLHPRPQYYS
ncbi:hypothetical protein DFP72DRAFT_111179 [Ephemerocybe angulata]|uniref:Uncharacterized protein n=1 Tax=Ephemerocybe angulata TaxID=980116 RepID=A0A8H6HBB7_9AGAR|nr:hypothetical protein DFP72DRAFT_111179 [Tulosesus angulatus]